MAAASMHPFPASEFLAEEREKDLLRFSTAGSVDDGKSTLIGRLLYDTQSVYEDQVRSIEGKGTTAPGQIDFALLTDGLRAEREQGITIDVAYRYFSTPRRKFIIADTPGHEQYTRNMTTGASTADAAVVLIDASKGVLIQSRRHAYIASLLRGRHALAGDNIVHKSKAMPWYEGAPLLELLESLPSSQDTRTEPFRFAVQRVLRPDQTFRGFAGQIASGTIAPGDRVTVLPSGRSAEVARIVTFDGDHNKATAPQSVALVLDREIDISRGDMIVSAQTPATVARNIQAALVWMDQQPLQRNRRYLLKHTSQTVPAFVSSIAHRTNIGTLAHEAADSLEMNGIGVVNIDLLRPIALDLYSENRSTGAFILIDAETNSTVAAGMITAASAITAAGEHLQADTWGPVTAGERAARWGHRGGVIELSGPADLIDSIERSLFSVGVVSTRIDTGNEAFLLRPSLLETVTRLEVQSGLLALVVNANEGGTLIAQIDGHELSLDAYEPMQAISAVHRLLHDAGIFIPSEKAGL